MYMVVWMKAQAHNSLLIGFSTLIIGEGQGLTGICCIEYVVLKNNDAILDLLICGDYDYGIIRGGLIQYSSPCTLYLRHVNDTPK